MSARNTPNLSAHRRTVNLSDDELDREAAAEHLRAQFAQGLAVPIGAGNALADDIRSMAARTGINQERER